MAIVQSINLSQFCDAFRSAGREDQFSYEGLEVLFDYLENYSEDTGEPIELDVIALCCEYTEASIEELIEEHGIDISDADGDANADEDEIKSIVEEFLQQNTIVCGEVSGGFVYAAF